MQSLWILTSLDLDKPFHGFVCIDFSSQGRANEIVDSADLTLKPCKSPNIRTLHIAVHVILIISGADPGIFGWGGGGGPNILKLFYS